MNDLIEGYASLGADINKVSGTVRDETKQGVVSEKLPELTLEMSNEELGNLTEKWEKSWNTSEVKTQWEKCGDENQKYWEGKQFEGPRVDGERAMVDNLIFESLETYLPQATRRNPDPLVALKLNEEQSEANQKYVLKVKETLASLADENRLRLTLKSATRHWAIYLIGVLKYGWDLDNNIPTIRAIRPRKMIFDPKATVNVHGYTGKYLGEYREMEAGRLLATIKDGGADEETIKDLEEMVKDKLGTDIQFIEWWTAEYMCWTLKKKVLLKKKNPHWNYDKTETATPTDLTSPAVQVDNYGNATAEPLTIEGINHFSVPKMPYSLLSVFNLGDQPVDKTSLIGQNLSNQDLINKKNKQITKNTDGMNGGMVVSLERSGLSETQAKNVATALRNGGVVVIPSGSPSEAVQRMSSQGLPADIFNQLVDTRARLRDIFGTRGSSPAGVQSEQTVRGKILSRSLDTDRIGGGISEYLEQLADEAYNWFLQLLYVYDSDFQFINGKKPPKLDISIREGSLLPKDSTSIANQAIDLASAGKMSTLDLYKRLEYPNPEELAANAWLEVNAPEVLYRDNPLIQQVMQMRAQAAAMEEQVKAESEMQKMQVKHAHEMEKSRTKRAKDETVNQAPDAALNNVSPEMA